MGNALKNPPADPGMGPLRRFWPQQGKLPPVSIEITGKLGSSIETSAVFLNVWPYRNKRPLIISIEGIKMKLLVPLLVVLALALAGFAGNPWPV